ncbi:hypothetical protein [Bacillus thuringiensis]|uniref:Uncharacterized protein n=1 Tax=Bacillus thuringiensis TaxID=1428 RepID=A0A9X7BSS4_BACTU|nr:hypothetical protein [Bacillus thuringiensis]PFV35741.1 hypothetical protein COK99_01590 [Bacillus thuringiensis]
MDSLTTTENKSERVLLGTVGVDTGQLFISDPSYIEHSWTHSSEGELLGIKFWGQAEEKVKDYLEQNGYSVIKNGGSYFVTATNSRFVVLNTTIKSYADEINEMILTAPETTSTYDAICRKTLGAKGYGKIDSPWGVAFTSGLGDGSYNVYGTIQDIKGWGERITKVEIELIPDEFIAELEAAGEDHA